MSKVKIETVQNIDVEFEVANIGERIIAFILDILVILLYVTIVLLIISNTIGFDKADETLYLVLFFTFSLPVFAYHLLMEVLFNGQSVGKMALKIKVIRLDGESPTIGNYLLRWLLRLIDITLTQGGIAVLCILLNEKGQRLGDLAAGTIVVKLKQATSLKDTVYAKLEKPKTEEVGYTVKYPQVSQLSDEDIATIREITNTANKTGNLDALAQLLEKLKEVLDVEPDEPTIPFIKQLIKDYNYLNNNT